MKDKICLIWKGHITEINDDGTFTADLNNVIENTTKEYATFEASDIEGELKVGKVFYMVITNEGKYLEFMRNVSHEEKVYNMKKAKEEAKKMLEYFEKNKTFT